jgi:SpoVK/Ycf46/Vps4 family AAA+-type ATPase
LNLKKFKLFSVIDWIKTKIKKILDKNVDENLADSNDTLSMELDIITGLTQDDFDRATKCVKPSSKREGFATVPDVTWADVGALHNVRDELTTAILVGIKNCVFFYNLYSTRYFV